MQQWTQVHHLVYSTEWGTRSQALSSAALTFLNKSATNSALAAIKREWEAIHPHAEAALNQRNEAEHTSYQDMEKRKLWKEICASH